MDASPDSRSTLERWIALLVRYWAYNMTFALQFGSSWPGFGYTDSEKAEMSAISERCSLGQYLVWLLIVSLVALPVIAVTCLPGMYFVIFKTDPATLPASIFFLSLGVTIAGCFTLGIPVSMLLSSALAGRIYKVANPQLPDRATTARFFHKLWFQLTRMALVMMVVLVSALIFIPENSRIWVASRLVMPILGPAVLVMTSAYYASGRLRRSA